MFRWLLRQLAAWWRRNMFDDDLNACGGCDIACSNEQWRTCARRLDRVQRAQL